MTRWLLNLLIALDQLVNALFGGFPDETMSAYAHRVGGWRRDLINGVFFWQDDHCAQSYWAERNRKQLPADYRL